MEFRNINTFIIAADKLNFSKTAEQLGYTQAAVTIQIKQLEEELSVRLFERIGKNVYLTDKGREFLDYAIKIRLLMEEAAAEVGDSKKYSGIIRVGMSESIFSATFPSIIKKFHMMYPNVKINVRTGIHKFIFDMMMDNELDLAYVIQRSLTDNGWKGKIVKEETAYFIASSRHPLAKRTNISIEDILKEDIIMAELYSAYSSGLIQKLTRNGKVLNPFLEVSDTDMIRTLVEKNQGISFVPKFVVENDINEGKISILSVPGYEVKVYRQILWHQNKFLTKPMRDLMELMIQSR